MNYTITESDKEMAFSKWADFQIKFLILNPDGTILENMQGIVSSGSLRIDGLSSIRRTYHFSLCPLYSEHIQDKIISWMGHDCLLQIGIKTPRTNTYQWYNQGKFVISNTSFTYDAQTNSLSVNCNDLFSKLNGTQNGALGSQTLTIPAYEEDDAGNPIQYNTIKKTIEDILSKLGNITDFYISEIGEYKGKREHNINYKKYREENPRWNCIPYDLEYSCGCYKSDIITELAGLYPNYDAAFDENGVFVVEEIPSCENDPVILDNDTINRSFVSESTNIDYNKIRNICEVWGKTFETDFYSENCVLNNNIYAVTLAGYDEYYNGDIVSIKVDKGNADNPYLNINNLGNAAIYDESTDLPIPKNSCFANEIYSFRCKKKYVNGVYECRFYLLGQWQPHALNVLTDGSVIKNGYTAADGRHIDKYSKEYFQCVYNCDNVAFMTIPDSPFTVQRIGERLDVKCGNEYDNISSSSLAAERARYENWKNCRLTDEIILTLNTIVPWIKENMKISYIKKGADLPKEYITKAVTLDFDNGTTSIELYTFYPLYEGNDLSGMHSFLSSYSHETLSDYTHLEIRNIK